MWRTQILHIGLKFVDKLALVESERSDTPKQL